MTTKHQIVKTIVEMAQDNEGMAKSILGNEIVNACEEVLNRRIDVAKTKTIIDSASYLIEQIEKCDSSIRSCTDSNCIQQAERQKALFIESLTKCCNEL